MSKTTSSVGAPSFQERAARAPSYVKKNTTYADFAAESSDNTDADVSLGYTLPMNCGILAVQSVRVVNWDGSDNTSIPLVIGDAGDLDRNLSSTEMCTDGTEDILKYEVTAAGGIVSTSASTTILATILAVASENPSTLTGGSADIYMFVVDFGLLTEGSTQED
jgi:hypothetical protein